MTGEVLRGLVLDEDRGFIQAPLPYLTAVANPLLGGYPWGTGPITRTHVNTRIRTATYQHCTPEERAARGPMVHCRDCDIARIADLVVHGWPTAFDDPHPVEIDFGFFDYFPTWPLVDGNHRVGAAIIRGDQTVDVSVAGDWDRAIAALVEGQDLDSVLCA